MNKIIPWIVVTMAMLVLCIGGFFMLIEHHINTLAGNVPHQSLPGLPTSTASDTFIFEIKNNNIYLNKELLVVNVPSLLGLATSTYGQGGTNGEGGWFGEFIGTADLYGNVKLSQNKDKFAFTYVRMENNAGSSESPDESAELSKLLVIFSINGHLFSTSTLGLDKRWIGDVIYIDNNRTYINPHRTVGFYVVDDKRTATVLKNIAEDGAYSPDGRFYAYNAELCGADTGGGDFCGVEACGMVSTPISEIRLFDFEKQEDVLIVHDMKRGFQPTLWSKDSTKLVVLEGGGRESSSCWEVSDTFVYDLATKKIFDDTKTNNYRNDLEQYCATGAYDCRDTGEGRPPQQSVVY